jgi:4-hydroxy-3-methylbut-2-en-1-yl diphosphate synthase IspG/GcpE
LGPLANFYFKEAQGRGIRVGLALGLLARQLAKKGMKYNAEGLFLGALDTAQPGFEWQWLKLQF